MGYGGGGGGGGGSGGSGGGSGASGGSGYRRVGDDRTANLKVDNITSRSGTDGTEVDGIVEVNTTAHFIPPSGTTAERGSRGRGLFAGGQVAPSTGTYTNHIEYLTIATLGNGNTFGDLSGTRDSTASVASSTRAVFSHGYTGGAASNTIEYVSIHSTGNAFDFGDSTISSSSEQACGNEVRGLIAGGGSFTTIKYITIATKGNTSDFGNLTSGRVRAQSMGSAGSPVRGIFAGGGGSDAEYNIIDYVTIATTGDAQDFGDLSQSKTLSCAAGSSSTRMIIAGGADAPGYGATNTIDYITMTSIGDAIDFGDLTAAAHGSSVMSNSVRAVIYLGGTNGNGSTTDTINYVTIATTGNAADFGDRTITASYVAGSSDSHGGLG